jgi:hypothetical protein
VRKRIFLLAVIGLCVGHSVGYASNGVLPWLTATAIVTSWVGGAAGRIMVAEAVCKSNDGSRTCACETKCHSTDDDCECEDD